MNAFKENKQNEECNVHDEVIEKFPPSKVKHISGVSEESETAGERHPLRTNEKQ